MDIRPLTDRVQTADHLRRSPAVRALLGPAGAATSVGARLALRSAELAALQDAARALQHDGVEFRRRKTILGIPRQTWTAATPSEVAQRARRGQPLQAAAHGTDWIPVNGIADLSVLDGMHGVGTPQSLPHAVLAQILLALERNGARLQAGSQNVGAYGAYQALTDHRIEGLRINGLPVRDEEEAYFSGWLAGQAPASILARPELAEDARALDARHLDIGAADVVQAYDRLRRAAPTEPLAVFEDQVRLGAADPATVRDPHLLGAWLDDRQAELRATRAAIGDRAVEAFALLRDDGDTRPFADRLDAARQIFAAGAKSPAPLYAAVRSSAGSLHDRAGEMAAVIGILGPRLEARAADRYAHLQQLPEGAPRQDLLSRLRAAMPTFQTLAALVPESVQDAALQQLLAADPARLPVLARIAAHVHAWHAEGAWSVGRAADGTLTIADNTVGHYASNADNALTSVPFQVPAAKPDLTFKVRYELEKRYDFVALQISEDGTTWTPLKRYTGSGSGAEKLDLSAWAGRTVRLRLAIHSDGSNTGLGIRIDHPAVGGTPLDERLDGELVSTLTGSLDAAALEGVAGLAERLDDAHAAVLLMPWLAPDLQAPDFADRVDALAALTKELGIQDAGAAWREVRESKTGTIPERRQRMQAAHELAAATCREPRFAQLAALYRKLDACGADASLVAPLLEAAQGARAFHPEAAWAEVPFEGGTAWTDSPQGNYANNADNGVTTEAFSLAGIHGAALAFDLKYALEQGFDHACLELSQGDGRWTRLADYTGRQDTKPARIDLSAYDGKHVQLRMRIKSDGSKQDDGVYFGNLRLQGQRADGTALDVPLADQVNAPLLRELVDAATDTSVPVAERRTRVETIARLGQAVGSVQTACLLWPLLAPHAGQPGALPALIALQQQYGLQSTIDAWPWIEAAGPASFADRIQLYQAARKLADALYTDTRAEHAAALYEALARVGSDRALAESLTALAAKGQPFLAEGKWGRVGEGWEDSPGAPYAPNTDASLTTQPLSLAGRHGARLRYTAGYATEKTYDWCTVEVSDDGRRWKELARYTGTGTADGVDLSAWDGRRIQVRFHFHSDGSNQADGITLARMRIESDNHPPTALQDLINAPLGSELLAAATAPEVPLKLRSRNLQCVAKMADRLHSTQQAALLWPLLADFQRSHDFADRADALSALAQEYGVEAAFRMWPAVAAAGGPARLADRVALLRASLDAARTLYRDTSLDQALAIYQKIAASGADRGVFDRLGGLLRSGAPWHSDGVWQAVAGADGHAAWDDSPDRPYANHLDTSLTTAPFVLDEAAPCTLRFDASYSLERNYDFVYLEASEDGQHWTEVGRYNGDSGGTKEHSADLGRWRGRSVQLRWRLKTDGSNAAEGMRLSNVRLDNTALEDAVNAPLTHQLLAAATDATRTAEQRAQSLRTIERMAQRVGSVQAAAMLWPALSSHLADADFDALADVTAEFATRYGVGSTVRTLPVLQSEGQGPMSDRVALFDAAWHLAVNALSPPRVAEASLQIYRQLVAAGSDAAIGKALARFNGDLAGWSTEGTWGREQLPDGTSAWCDSPGKPYAANVNASLTSAAFAVPKGAALCFDEQHQTEKTYDYCALEASQDGRAWRELARYTGSEGRQRRRVELSAYAGDMLQVRFHMKSDGSNAGDGIQLWNAEVEAGGKATPVEDAANLSFLPAVVAAATDPQVAPADRAANMEILGQLPAGGARRVLAFQALHPDVPLGRLLTGVMEGMALGGDIDTALHRAAVRTTRAGRIEATDDAVVVGGIRIEKRKA